MFVKAKHHVTPTVAAPVQPIFADGREYIVSLVEGTDYDSVWNDIENQTIGLPDVPNRAVRIINERMGSLRQCHYALTDAEAAALRRDSRIYSVEIPPQYRRIKPRPKLLQHANFTKPSNYADSNGDLVNWALPRVNSATNNYGSTNILAGDNVYAYILDGSGVDVVIQDSGLQVDHPEFVGRVQLIDWYAASGLSGTQDPNHYRDHAGHGTHVAGIAAGKTYGWAKNANIYSVKVQGLEGTTDQGTGIPFPDCFDVIRMWHLNKLNSSNFRPTIVNMSWGYEGSYVDQSYQSLIVGGNYRGSAWTDNTTHPEYGMGPGFTEGFINFPIRDPSTDVALQELIAAGITVCIAAGNDFMKIDSVNGPDYNNYWTDGVYAYYYNQGSSPYSAAAINVGSIDTVPYNDNLDQKATYSNAGPGVDVFVPGTYIFSATSNTNDVALDGYQDAAYFLDPAYRQLNLSGTSMASPQACGLGALFLQLNPQASIEQVKKFFVNNAQETLYFTGSNNDYQNYHSLWGGSNRMMFNRYNSNVNATLKVDISGNFTFQVLP